MGLYFAAIPVRLHDVSKEENLLRKDYTEEELEQLILHEKKALSREFIEQAWEEAASEDIDTNLIAEICINIALEKLASSGNLTDINRFLKHVKNLDEVGLMRSHTTLQ